MSCDEAREMLGLAPTSSFDQAMKARNKKLERFKDDAERSMQVGCSMQPANTFFARLHCRMCAMRKKQDAWTAHGWLCCRADRDSVRCAAHGQHEAATEWRGGRGQERALCGCAAAKEEGAGGLPVHTSAMAGAQFKCFAM